MATYEWESVTLGQNAEIQKIVSAAAQASQLVNTNIGLAKSGLQLAQKFLLGVLNPKILILNAIADEIDNFANDLKGTGFHILEVVPTGFEIVPTDSRGEPISLIYTADQINTQYAKAIDVDEDEQSRGIPLDKRSYAKRAFLSWAEDALGESNFVETGPTKSEYSIRQGATESSDDSEDGGNTDEVAKVDGFFGIPKLTFSQVVTQMVGAMDDELDTRRPQFSDSAEVGAIAVIIGVSDFSKALKDLDQALKQFIEFFGGDNGIIIGGFKNVGNLLKAPLKTFEEGGDEDDDIILNLINVSLVRGTIEDKEKLPTDVKYNDLGTFEEGELVIGPKIGLGRNAMGIIKTANTDLITSDTPFAPYSSQTVVVSPVSKIDAQAFKNFSNGAQLQTVSFETETKTVTNQNTGQPITVSRNSFKYVTELTSDDAKNANVKVTRQKENILLKPSASDVTETHSNGVITNKFKIGTIFSPQRKKAPPPNFKTAKLEDIIGEFGDFFTFLNTVADTIRNMADDSSEAIKKMVKFLNEKIKELDEFNKTLQRILKLFSEGLPQGGVYVLTIPNTVGGNELIKSALKSSKGKPTDDLDFCVGYLIVGGGPSMKVMNGLLGSL